MNKEERKKNRQKKEMKRSFPSCLLVLHLNTSGCAYSEKCLDKLLDKIKEKCQQNTLQDIMKCYIP